MENIEQHIIALRQCAKEHEGDKLFTGQINTSDLCRDTAQLLENIVNEQYESINRIEPLTDSEKRIFYAAMNREHDICKKIDVEKCDGDVIMLVPIVSSITRKVKKALWRD